MNSLNKKEAGTMALITCPECGREISDQAAACPHCGYPIGSPQKKSYSVVLVAPGLNSIATVQDMIDIFHLSQEEAKAAVEELPTRNRPAVLVSGLSLPEADVLVRQMHDPNLARVVLDSKADDKEALRQAPVPEAGSGMSFGATVGAVILGVIAAILILSFL